MLRDEGALHASVIDQQQSGSAAAWKTADGTVHLLFANIEEGLLADADQTRQFSIELPCVMGGAAWA